MHSDDMLQGTDDRWQLIEDQGEFNRRWRDLLMLRASSSSAAHIDTQLLDIAAAQVAGRVSCSCTGVPSGVVHALFTHSMPDGRPEKPGRIPERPEQDLAGFQNTSRQQACQLRGS